MSPTARTPRGIAIRGRTTIQVLGLNDEMRQLIRCELWVEGLYSAAME